MSISIPLYTPIKLVVFFFCRRINTPGSSLRIAGDVLDVTSNIFTDFMPLFPPALFSI